MVVNNYKRKSVPERYKRTSENSEIYDLYNSLKELSK